MVKATFISTLLFSALLLSGGAAHAAGKVEFDCPDLRNEKKRSIEPLYQGYEGWFFRDNDLKMDFSISPETARYFKRLNEALEAKGTKLIMVPLLSRALMAPTMVNHEDPWQENYDPELAKLSYTGLVNDLQAGNISVVSLLPLSETYAKNDPYLYNFKRDIHWKPESSRLIAKAVSDSLIKIPEYDSLTKVKTVSKEREKVGRAGTITEELQKLCKGDIQAESYKPYSAERILEESADALFGSGSETTPVALVGTSFSAVDEFNFLPFLEESSRLAVANFSIAGGGMFTSIISYLSSPFFQEHVPPVMIWETQSVYNFNKGTENLFRQAIPAVQGACSGDLIVASSAVELTGDNNPRILLDNLKSKSINGTDYYLHIVSDNLGFKQFTLEMDYDNEDGEWFPLDRSDHYDNKGHYYIELSDKISGNLERVTMKDIQSAHAKLDVTLCQKPGTQKTTNTTTPDQTITDQPIPKEKEESKP